MEKQGRHACAVPELGEAALTYGAGTWPGSGRRAGQGSSGAVDEGSLTR